ncbi:hypothetical protein [Ignatzschineria sp. LJL83]
MLKNPVRLSLDQKLQKIIQGNYNFNVFDILKKAIASIKGLKLKYFLVSLISLAINLIFLGISIAMTPSHHSFAYSSSMPGIGAIIFMLFNLMINVALVAGFSQITLRHLRKWRNPLLDGLFSFFPIMGRLFLINIVLFIFTLIPLLGMGFLLQSIESSLFEGLLVITLYCVLFAIALFYSLVLFIMADYPTMGFWKVMETSRKLIMNRWLKIGVFYLVLFIILYISMWILFTVIALIVLPLLIANDPYTAGILSVFIYVLLAYFIMFIISLWLIPFLTSVHGLIYLHLINDPYLEKNMNQESSE